MSEENAKESVDKGWLSEAVRELALSGLAAVFMTEDSIRKYLKEMKLPKELAALLLDGAAKKKEDLYAMLAKEFGKMLSRVDISSELSKFLEKHRIHFEAKVSFEPRNQPVTPTVEEPQ